MAQSDMNKAIDVLRSGGIIAHHTDTVVGFACLPKRGLLQRLERIKHRLNKQGFILLASNTNQVKHLLNYSAEEEKRLQQPLKRPTTWIINASDSAPASLKSEKNQVAVRISNHPNIAPITQALGPVVSTSANLTQLNTCTTPNEVRKQFGPQIDYIVRGEPNAGVEPSMIIDIHSNTVLRS
jgi:L-threonylcarbamoyladenylate synthase